MAKRTFRGYVAESPVEFTLESPDGVRTLDVHCRNSVPGFVILDFMSKADTENPGTLAAVILDLLQASIVEDEWEKFEAFVNDETNGVSIDVLAEVAGYVSDSFGAVNPTPPAPSRRTSSRTGR